MYSVIRSQWKRALALGTVYYGTDYGVNRFRAWQRRTLLSIEAAKYGDEPLPADGPLPKLTVVLDLRYRGEHPFNVALLSFLRGAFLLNLCSVRKHTVRVYPGRYLWDEGAPALVHLPLYIRALSIRV